MTCFLCLNEVEDAQGHLCVKDNSALFKQHRREERDAAAEFQEYLDELEFFDAVQVIE